MNQTRRLRRRCIPTPAPRGGYGADPPASRVANALAARRACGPGASAAPDAQTVPGQGAPCPPHRAALSTTIKIKSLQIKSLRFQGIATYREAPQTFQAAHAREEQPTRDA
jgi:hypothetical protein